MLAGLTTPGAKSSEFLVMILNVIAQIILAATDTLSSGTATKYSVFGIIAYAISRGLAKYEGRGTVPAPPPPPPNPPVA